MPVETSVISSIRVPVIAATLFVSAFLLFLCQPMVGKMVLPNFGGAAAVWTTCVLFFQAMLLMGYIYAHLLARVENVRKQIFAHATLLLLPLAFLPIGFHVSSSPLPAYPVLRLLAQLFSSVGVPFFVVSATAPLLQNWLTRTTDPAARDPYFLYTASNIGSLSALAVYPLLLEPTIGVSAQMSLWSGGYAGLMCFIAVASTLVWRRTNWGETLDSVTSVERPSNSQRLYWTAAAFVPSGLMLAVTNHIAADLVSAPFVWVLPLAIYLLTFILAFARRPWLPLPLLSKVMPALMLALFPFASASLPAPPGTNWIVIGIHLILLAGSALLCHTALASSRPDPRNLTEFYFWIALGGVLGGMFIAILAPLFFKTILEYPLLLAMTPLFRPGQTGKRDLLMPILFGAGVLGTWFLYRSTGLDTNVNAVALAHTAFFFVCYKFRNLVRRFAVSFAILMLTYAAVLPGYVIGATSVYTGRNFFGMKKVLDDSKTQLRKLFHGDTLHGIESITREQSGEPLSYYYRTGPVGEVVDMMRHRGQRQRFAVIGLGSGSMAAYADSDHHVTFYEIDPSVESIARRFFTFLPRCGANCDVVIGDGRLRPAESPDGSFDLLMLDAFSSDSIPSHLVSREALQLYLLKLAPDGVLLFHVSNRYLDVERLVSALVGDAQLAAYSRMDEPGEFKDIGKTRSNYVIAARHREDIDSVAKHTGWKPTVRPENFRAWTDDYSNLLGLIRWK